MPSTGSILPALCSIGVFATQLGPTPFALHEGSEGIASQELPPSCGLGPVRYERCRDDDDDRVYRKQHKRRRELFNFDD